jgi:hypothetical protein
MSHPHGVIDPELQEILHTILRPGQGFGHRQHINLAYLAVHRHGMPAAIEKICTWIQQIAAHDGVPHKYHNTVSRAWVELVAHHVAADSPCTGFERFARHNPALFDKQLLTRHYRATTLASDQARHGWAEPDLAPFPWSR